MYRYFHSTIALTVLIVALSGFTSDTALAAEHMNHVQSLSNQFLWEFKTNGIIYATPLIHNGVVYIGSLDSCFYALNATTGEEQWHYKSQDQIFSTPVMKDTILSFESGNVLYGVNLQGKLSWSYKMVDGPVLNKHDEWDYYHSSPLLVGNIVYIGTEKGVVVGVDIRTGANVFQCQTPSAGFTIETTPAVYDNKIYFGDWDGQFFAYDLTTGNLVWQYNTKVDATYDGWVNAIVTDPVIFNDAVYFGGRSCNLYCLDAKTGAKRWMTPDGRSMWILGGPTLVDTVVYIGSSLQNSVRAFNALTGSLQWNADVQYRVNGKPTVVGDFVFVGTEDISDYTLGTFCALNKTDGSLKTKITMGTQIYSTPTLSNGIFYFGGSNGTVYAVSQQGMLSTPYPKMQLSCPDTINFGSFPIGTAESTYKLYVRNIGNGPDSVTISSTMGQISIQPANLILAAGDSQEVTIKVNLTPLSARLYRPSVIFTSQKAVTPTVILKPAVVRLLATSGVENESEIPHSFSLSQNYPNPFNPSSVIQFQLPEKTLVDLRVYNALGKEVVTLVNEERSAGIHVVTFNASRLSSGVYYYRLVAGNFSQSKRLAVIK
ncbi:MAG: T9SS C-terminal target domain-containing protein [Ignavibacteriae bacterium]|nr:MAG: T9SS C-terminal target domain-containing protein [Ignavibacteriota bacterium]